MTVKAFAPAKINLTLHITGQRDDGYHLLDSLVAFAGIGDQITVGTAANTHLKVTGPRAAGVPLDGTNLVVQAAKMMGVAAKIHLHKNLPHAAGIGGGSSDAAATLRALSKLSDQPVPENALELGADVPVCLLAGPARMWGMGDMIMPLPDMPKLHAVLVNPNLPVPTKNVFKSLINRVNLPMPDDIPMPKDALEMINWLAEMRNDLQVTAIECEPGIAQVLSALEVTPGCHLARMSGSGGTCFGLYPDAENAAAAAGRLRASFPGWWVVATTLNG